MPTEKGKAANGGLPFSWRLTRADIATEMATCDQTFYSLAVCHTFAFGS
jgi:hypothetical protein